MRYPHYVKVSAISPACRPAAIEENLHLLSTAIVEAARQGIDLLVTPELSLTGYTAGDLFLQTALLDAVEAGLLDLAQQTAPHPWLTVLVGAPLRVQGALYNTAVVLRGGHIWGAVPKSVLPNHREFYEKRWFREGLLLRAGMPESHCHLGEDHFFVGQQLFEIPLPLPGSDATCREWAWPLSPVPFAPQTSDHPRQSFYRLGIEICEDLWAPHPPSVTAALSGAEVLANLSASPALVSKSEYRRSLVLQQSARLHALYIYASSGSGESTTDLVFSGHCMIATNGHMLQEISGLTLPETTPDCTALVSLAELRTDRLTNDGFSCQREQLPHVSLPAPSLPAPSQGAFDTPVAFPFLPQDQDSEREKRLEEILQIQALGLAKRLTHIGNPRVVLGVSGGLDSTLALLVASRAFALLKRNPADILAITLPGFGTTGRTRSNALRLAETLGATCREISIAASVSQHFQDIGQDPNTLDITYENAQARERTQVLMDVANRENGLVLGTGDLSELALGWCTYNGDHMSMYGINTSVPKTLVSHLVRSLANRAAATARARESGASEPALPLQLTCQKPEILAEVLESILETPISPELLPPDENGNIQQITEDTTGPYALHDFFLFHMLRYGKSPAEIFALACRAFGKTKPAYSPAVILHWLRTFYRRFFSQQFKRSCMPDGPKIGSVSLSPRGDWRMPSDAVSALWLRQLDDLASFYGPELQAVKGD